MLSTNGKNPLVAATYYFNPGGSLLRTSSGGNSGQSGLDSGQFDSGSSLEGKSSKVTKRDRNGGGRIDEDNGSCSSADGRKGSCYEATECVSRGGTPMGSCNPSDSGSVCCICKYFDQWSPKWMYLDYIVNYNFLFFRTNIFIDDHDHQK